MSRRSIEQRDVQVLSDGSLQPDLFGLVDAELARRLLTQQRRAEFEQRARFLPDGTPVQWVAPYDAPTARQGQSTEGWRCWLCGEVVANEYVLSLVHGLHADHPDVLTRAICDRQTPTPATTPIEGDVR